MDYEFIKQNNNKKHTQTDPHKKLNETNVYFFLNSKKSFFFKKVTKIDKLLTILIIVEERITKLTNVEMVRYITTDIKEIQGLIRTWFKNLCSVKLENWKI